MIRTIYVETCEPDAAIDPLKGKPIDERHYNGVIGPSDGAVDVIKPDGSALLHYRPRVVPEGICRRAFPGLMKAAKQSQNRGDAAGGSFYPTKKDGTRSRTRQSKAVNSGVAGSLDGNASVPCRLTAFTAQQTYDWVNMISYAQFIDSVFLENAPERYAAQLAVVQQTDPYWIILGTVFTTWTVNRNFRTCLHKDEGDLKEGFGVISVIEAGHYGGGYLVFPKYGIAVDIRSQDVLLCDVHEYHGNSPFTGDYYNRISSVFYYRAKMIGCGSPVEELEKARRQ